MQENKYKLERKDFIKMTAKPALATSAAVAFVLKTDAISSQVHASPEQASYTYT